MAPYLRIGQPAVDRELDVGAAQADVGEQPVVQPRQQVDRQFRANLLASGSRSRRTTAARPSASRTSGERLGHGPRLEAAPSAMNTVDPRPSRGSPGASRSD